MMWKNRIRSVILHLAGGALVAYGWAESQGLENITEVNLASIGFGASMVGWLISALTDTPAVAKKRDIGIYSE